MTIVFAIPLIAIPKARLAIGFTAILKTLPTLAIAFATVMPTACQMSVMFIQPH